MIIKRFFNNANLDKDIFVDFTNRFKIGSIKEKLTMIESFGNVFGAYNKNLFFRTAELYLGDNFKSSLKYSFIEKNLENEQVLIDELLPMFFEIFDKKNLNNKSDLLKKIFSDLGKIEDIAGQIKNINGLCFNFNTYLTGGALRDFFVGMANPKDLDILFSFEICGEAARATERENGGVDELFSFKREVERTIEKLKKVSFLRNFELDLKELDDFSKVGDFYKKMINEITKGIVAEWGGCEVEKEFDIKSLSVNHFYSFDLLDGVFKIKNKNFNFPIDVLVSSSSFTDYIDSYDFEFCKIGLDCKGIDKQNNLFDFLCKNSLFLLGALKSIKNKRLDYNQDFFTIDEMFKTFSGHYQRIVSKYPDFKLNFIGDNENNKKIINKYLLDFYLNGDNDLNQKKHKKNKI